MNRAEVIQSIQLSQDYYHRAQLAAEAEAQNNETIWMIEVEASEIAISGLRQILTHNRPQISQEQQNVQTEQELRASAELTALFIVGDQLVNPLVEVAQEPDPVHNDDLHKEKTEVMMAYSTVLTPLDDAGKVRVMEQASTWFNIYEDGRRTAFTP